MRQLNNRQNKIVHIKRKNLEPTKLSPKFSNFKNFKKDNKNFFKSFDKLIK
ncbi:MAG TPA: hypothetical protein PLD27_03220 [bacterium]|nr:hypothetical protein [bacterium]HOL47318.1 hypothetical protein [bacterium]HPQ17978.1 hypothetical protein [bacterium]